MAFGNVNVPGVSAKELGDVKTIAETAKSTADSAKQTADTAKTTADAAKTAADAAKTAADAAKTAADNAKTAADTAAQGLADINQKIEDGEIGGGGSGGNTIKITFEAAFVGQTYTVTDGDDTKTGTVPEGLVVSVKVVNCNSTYTIKAIADNGVEYSTSVTTGAYYGQYTASLAVFNATINVTAVAGAEVKAVLGDSTFTATAGSDGMAAVNVNQAGTYTITATKNGATSNSSSVDVTAESTYTATVNFIVLTVTSESGAALSLVNGATTLNGGGTGADVFYLPNTGTWTATLTSAEETSTKSITVSEYKEYTLKVMFISEILEENDWEKIGEVSASGEAASYWSVGDTKSVTLNGTVGTLALNNLTVDVFILGINHNASREGSNRIHWAIGKIGGTLIAMCDSNYNNSYTDGRKGFNMNHWGDYNRGGWKGCDLRYDILGSTNKAPSGYGSSPAAGRTGYDPANYDIVNSPVANTLMAAMPQAVRKVMKTVTKYTDNVGNGSGDTAGNVTASVDYFFLLAEKEVYGGSRTYANSYEGNYQEQYDYFKAGNSKAMYKHDARTTAVWGPLRSPYYTGNGNFSAVGSGGSVSGYPANYCGGLLAGFST